MPTLNLLKSDQSRNQPIDTDENSSQDNRNNDSFESFLCFERAKKSI